MAPVSGSMTGSYSGMGGFSYKDLHKEMQTNRLFNVQCYSSFSFNTYQSIINNGYPPDKIVMGRESDNLIKIHLYSIR